MSFLLFFFHKKTIKVMLNSNRPIDERKRNKKNTRKTQHTALLSKKEQVEIELHHFNYISLCISSRFPLSRSLFLSFTLKTTVKLAFRWNCIKICLIWFIHIHLHSSFLFSRKFKNFCFKEEKGISGLMCLSTTSCK